MKKIIKGIVPALLLTTLATPGFAENRQGSFNLSPFVGGYVLDKDLHEKDRPMFGLRAGYNFTKYLGLEGMFGYSLTDTKASYGSRETDLYRYGGDILFHLMPDSDFVPFIAVGGGGINFSTDNTPSIPKHSAGLVSAGVGFKYFVSPNVALRADAREVMLLNGSDDLNFEYSGGLTFQFGGKQNAVVAKAATPVAVVEDDVDTTRPTVVFVAPVNGATTVYANQKASVAFSEDMDPASINGETFTLKQGETRLSGKVSTVGSNAIFTPANNFEQGKSYTATMNTGAKDLSGNALANKYVWTFNAGLGADVIAPTVIFTSPAKGDKTAPIDQKANVAFSENMDPATITASTFTLKQGNTAVDGKVTASTSTATFAPAKKFEKGKAYTATVTTGAKDLAGNGLAKEYVWNFTANPEIKVLGVLTTLENSHFDFNSAEISENGKTILNLNAAALKKDPKITIRVAGHTSASGSEEYNQALSERRAASVKDYLVKAGVDESRITTIGYGKKSPAKYEANPADKLSEAALANMRVVVEIVE